MTLYILKNPPNPLAIEVLRSTIQIESPIVVLLSHSGRDVYLYLIDEGVLTVEDPRFEPLRQAGLKLFACAYGAQQHGVPRKDERATYCGLVVLSNIVSSCDRFVALN